MRTVTWLLVLGLVGAIARAEPATGTVVISCNEADASLLVDGVLIPDRTPAVLALPAGTHTIEARKPPLLADKKVVEVIDQHQIKVRFELVAATPPPLPPRATGSAAEPAGSAAQPPPAAGSAAQPPPAAGSAATPIVLPASAPVVKASRCMEGGHEVACVQGPHCTEGGKLVPCKKGDPLPGAPPPPPPPATTAAIVTAPGAGSNAPSEPPPISAGAGAIEIATTAPHAVAYVDGAPVREAPCVLEVEPGEHVVAVYVAGMVPAEAVVRVAVAQRQRVELTPSVPRRRIDVPAQ
jgi:hypothetical protein